jgi:hypothetical protein
MSNNFNERLFLCFFYTFLILLSARASAAQIEHSVDVRVVHAPSELSEFAHLSSENDRFKITFVYDNNVVSKPPFYKKDGIYSGPQHSYRQAARLVKIERYDSNVGSLSFNNIQSFEPARMTTEPPTGSFRARWKSEENGGVRVFIEFRDVDLKIGDSSILLRNQLLESLNNSSGVFHFQFVDSARISGVFSE